MSEGLRELGRPECCGEIPDPARFAVAEPETRICPVCMCQTLPSEWTMDEDRCDGCCWDALETEEYGRVADLPEQEFND